jgi:hypothetical protein
MGLDELERRGDPSRLQRLAHPAVGLDQPGFT